MPLSSEVCDKKPIDAAVDVWIFWLVIAVLLCVAEIFTLTAALGLLGVAAVITSGLAAIGLPMPLQFLVFAIASVVGFVVQGRRHPLTIPCMGQGEPGWADRHTLSRPGGRSGRTRRRPRRPRRGRTRP